MRRSGARAACAAAALMAAAGPLAAQEPPPPPPKVWSTSAGVGLSLTSGNSDTSTFNANYSVVFDPHTRNVVKSTGLLIRGTADGELSANRLAFTVRDEYRANGHVFVYGQTQYLRDTFKEIDYLVAPTAGVGYKILDSDATTLSVDAGVGGVWEKNLDAGVRASGAVTLEERFSRTVSASTTVTQSLAALWKTDDVDDSLYHFGVGLAVAMSARTQIKLEGITTYKNRPPTPGVEKNDVSLLVAFVLKN
jgi:putative salt-induced outer membrane protein